MTAKRSPGLTHAGLAIAIAAAAACRPAAADEFADFRIPDHWVRTGSASLNASGSWSTSDGFGSHQEASRYSSSGSATLGSTRDSDHFTFGWSAAFAGDIRRDRERRASPNRFESSESWQGTQRLNGSVSSRLYPWRGDFGVGLTAGGTWRLSESNTDRAEYYLGSTQVGRTEVRGETREASLTCLPGFGQIRDATAVYAVDLIEQRLRETGALARPLSAATRRKTAELLYVAPDFDAVHERPARFFWGEFERLLREDGALASGQLDAYSLFRALEPLLGGRTLFIPGSLLFDTLTSQFVRLRGYFAGAVLEVRHRYQFARQDFTVEPPTSTDQHVEQADHEDEVRAGGRIAFHRPLGWHWQAGADTRLTVPVRPGEDGFLLTTAAAVTWLIADRWSAEGAVDHSREVFEPRHAEVRSRDRWSINVNVNVRYFLEDRLALEADLRTRQNSLAERDQDSWNRDTSVSLGIHYIFRGALDGPAGIEPQRLFHTPGAF